MTEREINNIANEALMIVCEFIKDNYQEMFLRWAEMSSNGFYEG